MVGHGDTRPAAGGASTSGNARNDQPSTSQQARPQEQVPPVAQQQNSGPVNKGRNDDLQNRMTSVNIFARAFAFEGPSSYKFTTNGTPFQEQITLNHHYLVAAICQGIALYIYIHGMQTLTCTLQICKK